ncbi:MAG: DUF4912 domain-containing protein [Candidatus Kuenenia sp.]|nr:DUF4912 domain-containing protein [Candidatus Kuenenia hertensis]
MKEIFLLIFEIFKALIEIVWEKIKYILKIVWIRFFGYEEIPPREEEGVEEWGVTGESEWPGIKEIETKGPSEKMTFPPPAVPELPENYGENRIVLMPRDPLCLFCYWELQQNKIDNFMKNLYTLAHDAKLALRVYDVTNILFDGKNANKYFDIELVQWAKDWYIHVDEPNRSFCIDIGFLTSDGTFHPLIRSNTITTPRTYPSEIIDKKWICVENLYKKMYADIGFDITKEVYERTSAEVQKLFPQFLSSCELAD